MNRATRSTMRKRTLALGVSGAALIMGGIWFSSLDKETRGFLATFPTNADVLTWSQTQRDAAFRALDRIPLLAKASEIAASPTPLALPPGKPLEIAGLDEYLAGQHAAGIVILQDGKVRLERYGLGFDAAGRWTSFSVAKSFTSTLVGAAVQDGAIKSLEDKVSQYVPDLRGSAYDDVTIRQLLTMSSGVGWNEDYEDANSDGSRFNGARPDPGVDATVSYMRTLPRAHKPGEVWSYNTGETNLVGVLVSSATGKPLSQYLQEKIWQPAGMEAKASWLKGKTGTKSPAAAFRRPRATLPALACSCSPAAPQRASRSCRPTGSPRPPPSRRTSAFPARATASSGGPTTMGRWRRGGSSARASSSIARAVW